MTAPGDPPDLGTLRAIAQATASGANRLLPQHFAASEVKGDIEVRIRGELIGSVGVTSILRDRPNPVSPDDIVMVAENVLSWLQDVVSEETTWPWPPVPAKPRGYMASCRAAAGDGWLRLWFEADGRPVTPIVEAPLRA